MTVSDEGDPDDFPGIECGAAGCVAAWEGLAKARRVIAAVVDVRDWLASEMGRAKDDDRHIDLWGYQRSLDRLDEALRALDVTS